MEGKFVVASGPVIVEDDKILLSKDNKDDFYKLPGGTVHEGETLEETCLRKVKSEIGGEIKIKKALAPEILWENPQTKEKMVVVLINYLAELKNKDDVKAIAPIQEIKWFGIEEIKKGGNVSPNVKALVEKEF